jgi:ATP/maltotriose-dependent transcriptional regulator MalT
LGCDYWHAGRLSDAEATFKHAVAIRGSAHGRNHELTIQAMGWLARFYRCNGKPDAAGRISRDCWERAKATRGRRSVTAAVYERSLGLCLQTDRKRTEAERMFVEAANIVDGQAGADPATFAAMMKRELVVIRDENEVWQPEMAVEIGIETRAEAAARRLSEQ